MEITEKLSQRIKAKNWAQRKAGFGHPLQGRLPKGCCKKNIRGMHKKICEPNPSGLKLLNTTGEKNRKCLSKQTMITEQVPYANQNFTDKVSPKGGHCGQVEETHDKNE